MSVKVINIPNQINKKADGHNVSQRCEVHTTVFFNKGDGFSDFRITLIYF